MSTVTDPIADFIARLRNGAQAQKIDIFVPYSKLKAEVARILKEEGYISEYAVDTSAAIGVATSTSDAASGRPARTSTPSGRAMPGR